MMTNPNTVGLFDPQIKTIADLLHDRGALLYLDGANMNAILGQVRPGAGADLDVKVVVFGAPHLRPWRVFAYVEVKVMIAFMARVEVKDRGAQAQRRQQPRLEVMELGPAGSGPGHVEPPRTHRVLVDGPHNALRIGVGTRGQIERLALRWMDGVTYRQRRRRSFHRTKPR